MTEDAMTFKFLQELILRKFGEELVRLPQACIFRAQYRDVGTKAKLTVQKAAPSCQTSPS
jgi:hypothetical protein